MLRMRLYCPCHMTKIVSLLPCVVKTINKSPFLKLMGQSPLVMGYKHYKVYSNIDPRSILIHGVSHVGFCSNRAELILYTKIV